MTESDSTSGGLEHASAPVAVTSEAERDASSQEALVAYARRLGPDPALVDVPDDALEERVRTGAAALAAATCAWLELLAELICRDVWAEQGARSPAVWLSWALGIGPSTARDHVRVALRLRECPATRDRFRDGTLSYSKVRAITRVADATTEPMLVRWADAATAAELEAIVRDARRVRRAVEAPVDRDDLGVTSRWEDDGTFKLILHVDGATGVEVEQLLDRLVELSSDDSMADVDAPADDDAADAALLAEPIGGATPTGARRSRRAALSDALVGALGAAVAAGPDDTSGADRHLAVVELSAATYVAAASAGAASQDGLGFEPDVEASPAEASPVDADVAGGQSAPTAASAGAAFVGSGRGRGRTRPIPLRQVHRLICNTRIDVQVHAEGHPADLGTSRRYPDARLRRMLLARDRSCRFPGCGAIRFLHGHHVLAWTDDGPTDLDNLVLLCGHHHRFVHRAGWRLQSTGKGRWSFHAPGPGTAPHPHAGQLAGASAGAVVLALEAHADRVDPRALSPAARDGFGYDHEMTVGVLLERLDSAA